MLNNYLSVTFRQVSCSDDFVRHIKAKGEKLRRTHCGIERCRVVIEKPHRRHRNGNRVRVNVSLSLPGKRFFASSETGNQPEDIGTALSAAFDSLENSVNGFVHRRAR